MAVKNFYVERRMAALALSRHMTMRLLACFVTLGYACRWFVQGGVRDDDGIDEEPSTTLISCRYLDLHQVDNAVGVGQLFAAGPDDENDEDDGDEAEDEDEDDDEEDENLRRIQPRCQNGIDLQQLPYCLSAKL